MINAPCENELLETVHQWVSSHCQGIRFYGDSPEQPEATSSAELELFAESHSSLPTESPVGQRDIEESPEKLGVWLNKVRDRIRVEASLCREFSARRLSENARRIYAARAAALEFAFKLLTESSNPMDYLSNPVPDHHVHPPERGIRSRRSETQHPTEVSNQTLACQGE